MPLREIHRNYKDERFTVSEDGSPGHYRFWFQIAGQTFHGKTATKLQGLAVRREQRDILREQFYTDADRSTCLTFVKLSIHPSEVENMDVSHETKAAVRPALWGAAAGAIALAIVGFSWDGWVTGGTAETLATNRAATAVVAALTPICVEKFRQAADASANLAEMKKTAYTWDQSKFVEKGGWATMPGSTEPNSAVAKACAESLGRGKAVELRG